ncbi:LCP family protein [Jeotgalibacillus sp. R-1-5s-1]|uniref:LCP family protein n=1 Tax=Jeotgalibacillus sp. R-1-5s-1 TaxID=2555897 RepID=UPI00106D9107|nr:LCP family protein [Jeotgalibacillus sp. R-1-5s-1]TFD95766.1 transcriptional regulator [Jeotgalibacillus sp. R-1-5s-1]
MNKPPKYVITRQKKNKRRKRLRIFLYSSLILALSIFAIGSVYFYNVYTQAQEASEKIYKEIEPTRGSNDPDKEIKVSEEPFTVLLVGVENQDDTNGRSDVLLYMAVNPKKEEIKMLSIPRDTLVYIDELGYEDKIAHSYSFGDIQGTVDAVNELTNVPVDYYVETNFDGFVDVVDTFDGVEVDIPFTFRAQLADPQQWKTFSEGSAELDGREALAYVRMRKDDPQGDIGRTERQQEVVKAIVDKAVSVSSITRVGDVIEDLGNNVQTNIRPRKFMEFFQLYSDLKNTRIEQLTLDVNELYVEGTFFYQADEYSLEEIENSFEETLGTARSSYASEDQENSDSETEDADSDY